MKMKMHRTLSAFCAVIFILAAACAHTPKSSPEYDAIVDASGNAEHRTVQSALNAAPTNSSKPYKIFIKNGHYYEKLHVIKPFIHLYGEEQDKTILTFDAASDSKDPSGQPYGTRGSFSFKVSAPDFKAENLTFENGYDYMANLARDTSDPARFRNPQGVAVMLDDASDRAVFRNCTIKGNQDTLFPNAGRSYFEGCTISGNVDFIFGAGTAVFDNCDIVSLDRGRAKDNGYITAASTHINTPYGFVFLNSRLKKDSAKMAKGSVHLGRPWHPFADSTALGHVVFVNTWMDDHISDAGWVRMSSLNAKGERIWFEPADARLFEYNSTGPGAKNTSGRRQLAESEATKLTVETIFNGWRP
jgi:pectinesterase